MVHRRDGAGLGNPAAVFTDLETLVPVERALVGLLFCTVIGLVTAVWPAVRAARTTPIYTLQYE